MNYQFLTASSICDSQKNCDDRKQLAGVSEYTVSLKSSRYDVL